MSRWKSPFYSLPPGDAFHKGMAMSVCERRPLTTKELVRKNDFAEEVKLQLQEVSFKLSLLADKIT